MSRKSNLILKNEDFRYSNLSEYKNSINCTIFDPPYNISLKGADWDTYSNDQEYAKFLKKSAENIQFVSKEFASVWVFSGWSYASLVKDIFSEYFTLQNWIIYDRIKGRGATKNFTSTREDLFWFTMHPSAYTFNKIPSTIKKKTGGLGQKNGNPFRSLSNVWSDISPIVPWSKEREDHPSQKPEQLYERILQIATNEWDMVMDPCFGSGTAAITSLNLNRDFLGIELDENYFSRANSRVERALKEKEKSQSIIETSLFSE